MINEPAKSQEMSREAGCRRARSINPSAAPLTNCPVFEIPAPHCRLLYHSRAWYGGPAPILRFADCRQAFWAGAVRRVDSGRGRVDATWAARIDRSHTDCATWEPSSAERVPKAIHANPLRRGLVAKADPSYPSQCPLCSLWLCFVLCGSAFAAVGKAKI